MCDREADSVSRGASAFMSALPFQFCYLVSILFSLVPRIKKAVAPETGTTAYKLVKVLDYQNSMQVNPDFLLFLARERQIVYINRYSDLRPA
jgi:hypothetical protein